MPADRDKKRCFPIRAQATAAAAFEAAGNVKSSPKITLSMIPAKGFTAFEWTSLMESKNDVKKKKGVGRLWGTSLDTGFRLYDRNVETLRGLLHAAQISQTVDQVDEKEYPHNEHRYRKKGIQYHRGLIGVFIDLSFDLLVADEGQDRHQSAEGDKKYPEDGGIAGRGRLNGSAAGKEASALGHPGGFQKIGELSCEEAEFFDNEPEGHDAYARPYPGEKRPFVRHVDAAVSDP